MNDQNLSVRKAYTVDIPMLDFGRHFCLLYFPLAQNAHCVTDITKFRPTNFFYFQDMKHPTAQSHALHEHTLEDITTGVSFEANLDFGGCVLKINYQCVNILAFFNETLPLVIYCFVYVCKTEGILSWELSFGVVQSHHAVHSVHPLGLVGNSWRIIKLKRCYQLQLANSSVDK